MTAAASRPPRGHRLLAWLWLAVVLAIAGHQAWLWTRPAGVLDSDVLAMLPRDERRPAVAAATRALADAGERRVVVLIGAKDPAQARRAGDAFAEALGDGVALRWRVEDGEQGTWLNFYAPWRAALLTQDDRGALQAQSTEALAQQALRALHQPVGLPRIGSWAEDPLNLRGRWLAERAGISRVRVQDGRLTVTDGDATYAVLMVESTAPAFAVSAQRALVARLEAAGDAARGAVPEARVLFGGVPLFAASAAAQAEREIHTIGVGSLIGIVLLTWCAFRSLRPRVLVTLSMAVGLTAAVSVTHLLFGGLHLITLVFGATLLGVAENYGSNYFCARMGLPRAARWDMLRRQWPIVSLAMLTTVIAYALIGIAPFPGLRQIAVFSSAGLLGAFVTVMLWFPWLDGEAAPPTRFGLWLGGLRARVPHAALRRWASTLTVLTALFIAIGLVLLTRNDDIRQLQSAPATLIDQQREVSRVMGLPGVARFVLVEGDSEEQLLTRDEAVVRALRALRVGSQAVSQWLPSLQSQRDDAALIARRATEINGALATMLDETLPAPAVVASPLLPAAWLLSPVSEPLRYQWLGRGADGVWRSAVLLSGGDTALDTARLSAAIGQIPGAIWVDKVGEISALLGRYASLFAVMVVAGHLLVWLALMPRFGRRAWRALVPTSLATLLTLAAFGVAGVPVTLFHLLPLLILLGLGVDYGIFLLEQPGRREIQPFLSVSLAALSTLLAFGLLALSTTPALRAFGLTLLVGVTLAWWLTPLFMPADTDTDTGADADADAVTGPDDSNDSIGAIAPTPPSSQGTP
jgi:predicted exporter